MKKSSTALIAAILAGTLSGFAGVTVDNDSVANDSVKGFVFTDVITIPVTSVKDQNQSGTCWCFSTNSFIENEILRKTGKEVDLSEMFVVRHCYTDKADRYVRMYGSSTFSPGGSILDVPYVFEKYGAMPEEVYKGLNYGEEKHVHGEFNNLLTGYVNTIVSRPDKKISTAWKKGFEGIMDAYLGKLPETFEFEGVTYTPQSYAASLGFKPEEYIALTSFTHHPMYSPFILEVADNWLWGEYMNIPMDELKAVVDNALEKGYTVAWAADISEGGFKWNDGVALMPKGKNTGDLTGTELSRWVHLSDKDRKAEKYNFKNPPVEEIEVTQDLRQAWFDSQETTDDHGMVIVGTATDQCGKRYYKVKNSWDTNQKYDGYIYVSEPFLLAKTINIMVHRDAVPKEIAKKINKKK